MTIEKTTLSAARRAVLIIGILLIWLFLLPNRVSAATVTAQGSCGADGATVTWSLDSDGVLTIGGSGAIADYDDRSPWYSQSSRVKKAVIESGVTRVGNYAFWDCKACG